MYLKKLLEKSFNLNLKLLEYCYKKKNYGTINYYSEELNVDRRTILKTIRDIERDIKENNWEKYLELEITETTVSITFAPSFSFENFYRYYMSQSLCVKLVELIFEGVSISLDDLIDNLFISKTTFYRRILPLKEVLKEFNLEIDFTKKQYILGEERQIRYFFSSFYWDIFRSTSSYEQPSLTEIKYLSKIQSNLKLSLESFIYFQICLKIALNRTEQGYCLDEDISYFIFEMSYSYSLFKDLCKPYFKHLSQKQQEREIHILFFFCTTITIYPQNLTSLVSMQKIPVFDYARQWIIHYTNYFNTILNNEEYLYLYVNLVLLYEKKNIFCGGTSTFGVNSVNEVLSEESPHILKRATLFFDYLSKKDEQFYIDSFQRLDYTLLIRRLIITAAQPVKLLVCSKVGLEEVEWIKNLIAKKSFVPVTFDFGNQSESELIISDFPLSTDFSPFPYIKTFIWLTFPNPEEWRKLLVLIEDIYYNKLDFNVKLEHGNA